ncbi:MAG: sigma 54-interacting transcriptional regulator [Thermoanaerobaculia bacterium]|nr:sigma 54-interacting transcriptional regulator [Thermoanaerobaculia bacterium]
MHRLVAYAHDGVQRFVLDREEVVIGADEECDIHLPFAGVGSRHAKVFGQGDELHIEDLGARKGVIVNGQKIRSTRLQVLDEIRLGSIALLLEDVQPDREPSLEVDAHEPLRQPTVTAESMLEHLARVSEWVLSDRASSSTLEALVLTLLQDFGGGVLFLFQGDSSTLGIKFVLASEARWLRSGDELLRQVLGGDGPIPEPSPVVSDEIGQLDGDEAWIAHRAFAAVDRRYLFALALPHFRPDTWSPLPALRTLADQLILGLVHHVGRYEPIVFGRPTQRDLSLAPGLVTGESPAMKRVLDQLRAAVDLELPVLIRGEHGLSKELLARSLHLSGTRSAGPFLRASCAGAKDDQLEADIFGAEVKGKTGVIEREGALLLADGGTLFLEAVESLPLGLQDRLVRFLRTRNVEPRGSLRARTVDVRIIASSVESLESYAGRDLFRLDLAYRLSQFVVEVPALRDRREDLPLLIQAAVNQCCHETGKRIQGITVKAMEALATHDYPGNLPELEAIIRRLVYLCPPGRPIDDSQLPDEVRLSKIKGLKPDIVSELELDKLVSDTERAAIREALRRSGGNKSEAARQLGLSRNGLKMKMDRLGL